MREDIAFQTSDNVTLRGWLYKPDESVAELLPCLIMCHGFSAVKEMDLDAFSDAFISKLPLACLVYDNRGLGDSDTREGQPRGEIIPAQQISDFSDAITCAQTLPGINKDKIGIWGSSYSGGHVLWIGAIDHRVKAVLSQTPMVDGWESFQRRIPADAVPVLFQLFEADRLGRMAGKEAAVLPVINSEITGEAMLPGPESFAFFDSRKGKSNWKNEVTLRSLEVTREYVPMVHVPHISPTPLLMVVAERDTFALTDLALDAYTRALEPKQLSMLSGGILMHIRARFSKIILKCKWISCVRISAHKLLVAYNMARRRGRRGGRSSSRNFQSK
ncbi:Alpha/Beta hydrolase protein, partial [Xylariales sp. PMI_506]